MSGFLKEVDGGLADSLAKQGVSIYSAEMRPGMTVPMPAGMVYMEHVLSNKKAAESMGLRMGLLHIFVGSPKKTIRACSGSTLKRRPWASNARGERVFCLGPRRPGSGACWPRPELASGDSMPLRASARHWRASSASRARQNPAGAPLGEKNACKR